MMQAKKGKAVLAAALAVALAASLCATGCMPSPSAGFGESSGAEAAQSSEYIIDKCGAIPNSAKKKLERAANTIAASYGCGTYFVVIEDYIEAELEQYAANLWQRRGLGIGDSQNGIIYIVCANTGEYALLTHGEMSDAFSESRLAEIEEGVGKKLLDGQWSKGAAEFLRLCEEALEHYSAHGSALNLDSVASLTGVAATM